MQREKTRKYESPLPGNRKQQSKVVCIRYFRLGEEIEITFKKNPRKGHIGIVDSFGKY